MGGLAIRWLDRKVDSRIDANRAFSAIATVVKRRHDNLNGAGRANYGAEISSGWAFSRRIKKPFVIVAASTTKKALPLAPYRP